MTTVHFISRMIIPGFILLVVLYGVVKKVRVYDCFVAGAKDGIAVVMRIFPYLLAIFVAVKSFQASGAMDLAKDLCSSLMTAVNVPMEVIPLAVIKPLSGSASIGVFTDIVRTTGPDSLATMISAVVMGSAETTFYVLAVYLGAVGIRKTRYLVSVCVVSDVVGVVVAIIMVKLFL